MSSADARLIGFVRSCRRRLVLAVFVRFAAYAAGALALVVTAMTIWRTPDPLLLSTGALAALAVGAVAAGWLTPTLKQTAHLVDRRQRLENSLVAALQARETPSPISDLIVKQSANRISGVVPSRAIPLGAARPVAAAAVALAIAAVAVSLPSTPSPSERRGGIRLASNSGGRPSTDTAAAAAPRDEASSQSAGAPAQATPATPSQVQRSTGNSAQPPSIDTAPSPAAGSGRQAATERTAPAGSPSAGNDGMGTRAGTGHSDAAQGQSATSSSTGAAAGSSGAAQGAGRGGGIQAAGGTNPAGAGGVRQGPVMPNPGDGMTAAAGTTLSAGLPPGSQRQESAITNEEVPARLRPYVRSYFQAIRP